MYLEYYTNKLNINILRNEVLNNGKDHNTFRQYVCKKISCLLHVYLVAFHKI